MIDKSMTTSHNEEWELVPWNTRDVFIATGLLFLSFLIVQIFLGLVIGTINLNGYKIPSPVLAGFLEGLMLLTVWAIAIKKYRARWRMLGLKRPKARWALVLPWLVLLGSLSFTAIYSSLVTVINVDYMKPPPLPDDVLGNGLVRLLNTLVIVLWVPFIEEVFFRGFLLAALIPAFGAMRAITIGAFIFAAAHLMPSTMIPLFVTGLLLSWLYVKTRSIWPPMTAHAAQNLIAISVAS